MRFFYLSVFLIGIALPSYSQSPFTAESEGYYTIVGAFAIKENAANLNASLQKNGMNTSYGFLASRNIYYVYALRSADVKACIEEMRELRKKPEFWDAWVRYIREDGTSIEVPAASVEEAPQSLTETPPTELTQADPAQPQEDPASAPEEIVVEENEEIIQYDNVTLGNTEVFLSLYNPQNDKVANGVVQVIDAERGRLIQEVPGNTYLVLPDPKSKSGNITLIADVLGYRKVQKEMNFNNPLADTSFITQMGTSLVANFEMVRYHTGDIRTLYNIYFYNDAAVMMPESKYELSMLLDMMQENLKYKIKLHGHTNGNYHGKIIKVGSDGDFFSVAKDAETTVGSAKELSESRAEVIKDWLVAQGIDASRIEVKAWGGKRPIFDKHSANAKKNIRVEVEVVAE
jgi:outer membrane protein OmpA-like peptidoglycan-associated protein